MTKDNQRKNIAAEIARAEESRRAADVLIAAGLGADDVSRAYCAAFHTSEYVFAPAAVAEEVAAAATIIVEARRFLVAAAPLEP